jgi:hypothetical protein
MSVFQAVIGILMSLLLLGAPRAAFGEQAPRYFGGYRCTDRCRDHSAGFQWARQLRLTRPGQCVGPTLSYVQGCQVYAKDRMRDGTKDDAGQPID